VGDLSSASKSKRYLLMKGRVVVKTGGEERLKACTCPVSPNLSDVLNNYAVVSWVLPPCEEPEESGVDFVV
jgi:hypothetical protein